MSGTIQHHFWRLMQAGFLDTSASSEVVWVYEKKRAPFKVNPKGYGAERRFYEDANGKAADEAVTDIENRLSPTILNMRKGTLTPQDIAMIPTLISHLEVRSRFFREELTDMLNIGIGEFTKLLSKPVNFRRLIFDYIQDNPQSLRDRLNENSVPSALQDVAVEYLIANLDAELRKLVPSTAEAMQLLESSLQAMSKTTVIESHNKALAESNAAPHERFPKYQALHYSLKTSRHGGFILPDSCLAVVHVSGIAPASQKDHVIEAVIVPLSRDIVLMGSPKGSFQREERVINAILATAAYKSFVAASNDDSLSKLQRKIGVNANLIARGEVLRIARNAIIKKALNATRR